MYRNTLSLFALYFTLFTLFLLAQTQNCLAENRANRQPTGLSHIPAGPPFQEYDDTMTPTRVIVKNDTGFNLVYRQTACNGAGGNVTFPANSETTVTLCVRHWKSPPPGVERIPGAHYNPDCCYYYSWQRLLPDEGTLNDLFYNGYDFAADESHGAELTWIHFWLDYQPDKIAQRQAFRPRTTQSSPPQSAHRVVAPYAGRRPPGQQATQTPSPSASMPRCNSPYRECGDSCYDPDDQCCCHNQINGHYCVVMNNFNDQCAWKCSNSTSCF